MYTSVSIDPQTALDSHVCEPEDCRDPQLKMKKKKVYGIIFFTVGKIISQHHTKNRRLKIEQYMRFLYIHVL